MCTSGGWERGTYMRKRITLLIAALTMALTMSFSGVALAFHKGQPHGQQTQEPTACETRGGGLPPGQQPECQGQGLEQETEVQNRGGNAPPGQNR